MRRKKTLIYHHVYVFIENFVIDIIKLKFSIKYFSLNRNLTTDEFNLFQILHTYFSGKNTQENHKSNFELEL